MAVGAQSEEQEVSEEVQAESEEPEDVQKEPMLQSPEEVLDYETIIFPECGHIQCAKVEDTIPFPIYIHDCLKCKYIIMESEWQTIKKKKGGKNGIR